MITEMKKRKYRLKERAVKQRATRERIVDAIMALHEELGPAATTVSAVADRAGVQRLTVYRHFPDEAAMLTACTSTWLGLNPPPDPGTIDVEDARARTRALLQALYRYYAQTEKMWTSAYRDVDQVPALAEAMGGFEAYLEALAGDLLKAWAPSRSKRLRATLAHVMRFATWQSLTRQQLGSRAMADLACAWVSAAAG